MVRQEDGYGEQKVHDEREHDRHDDGEGIGTAGLSLPAGEVVDQLGIMVGR